MIDTNVALRNYLLSQVSLRNHVGTRIYWPRLPETFVLVKAISFFTNGGEANRYIPEVETTIQFHCYGTTSIEARLVYRALFDVLHSKENIWIGAGDAFLIHAFEQGQGTDLIDPDTDWPFVLTFFDVKFQTG